MTIIRVRLDDEDRKRNGGDEPLPEELVLDTERLKDMEWRDLIKLDQEMDMAVVKSLLPVLEAQPLSQSTFVESAAVFLAIRQAGRNLAWAAFQFRPGRAALVQEADANPPAGPSERSSEE